MSKDTGKQAAIARFWPKTTAAVVCVVPLLVSGQTTSIQATPDTELKPSGETPIHPGSQRGAKTVGGQQLIAEVSLNGVRKGEFAVVALPDGDYLVTESDLRAMAVQPPYEESVNVDGQTHHSLRALGANELRFDEANLALFVSLPPDRLPKKSLDLLPGQQKQVLEPRDNSAFFNYNALYAGEHLGEPVRLSLSTELGVRIGDMLLRTESVHQRGQGVDQNIRYGTSLTHDDRRTRQRWIFGDFTATSGDLGSFLNLGGISFSQSYQIDPNLVRQPMASFTGNITSPSQAEIYLDGIRVRTETLQPGQFELKNLNYYGGQRDITVVLRDRFGREQTLVYPFYFTDLNLREGLHDYSYNIGLQRQNLGTLSNDYGKLAMSAFHRYGFSDSLTLGGRGEAEPGRLNLGVTAAARSNTVGVVSGGLSAGRSPAGRGWAGVARYGYQSRQFSAQTEIRRTSPNYETVGQLALTDRLKSEVSVGASYGTSAFGNLSIDWRQFLQYRGMDQRILTLGYSRTLFGGISLRASVSRVKSALPSTSSTHVMLALSYSPTNDITANALHRSRDGTTSDLVQVGKNTPIGEGLGYRIVGERLSSILESSVRLSPSLQYNGAHGVYTADFTTSRSPGGSAQNAYQLGISGGVAYVDSTLALSRPVTDSFGIVKVGELEGVRVYHSAQEIGRTDREGKVFLPNLGSYVANRVAIDDRDIPIDYAIADKELNISPPLRSGSLIRFDVMRIQAITGRVTVKVAGQTQPAEYVNLIVMAGDKEVSIPTGRDGEFYFENLKPGRHAARFVFGKERCTFELMVPTSQEMLIDLGELNVCQFNP